MPHRAVVLGWSPGSTKAKTTHAAARTEAARLWNDLVSWHAEARQQHHADPIFVTAACATDGHHALAVSGREIKATIQWREKRMASLKAAQAAKTVGSRRFRRLQRRKYRLLDKAYRRIHDLLHKTSRKIADAFSGAHAVAGKPFNDAARKLRRTQAQQVSQACTRKLLRLLNYKLGSCREVGEAFSSQHCPPCGALNKGGRLYHCKACGFEAPRDVVGGVNILQLGQAGKLVAQPGLEAPEVRFVHPNKYPGRRQVVPVEPREIARSRWPRSPVL